MSNPDYYNRNTDLAFGRGCMAAVVIIAAAIAAGVVLLPKPTAAPDPRQCIVIDLRTKPGPGKIIPAEPGI